MKYFAFIAAALFALSAQAQLNDGVFGAPSTPAPASSATELFVDPVAGDDGHDGLTSGAQMRTIQAAIAKLLPSDSHAPVTSWGFGEDRTIHVKYTAAMDPIREHVIIPEHAGSGALIIAFEEETVASGLIESGSVAAISGFVARKRITLTTSPLTPAALADNSFVTLTNRDTLEPIQQQAALDDLPVVTNGAGSIDVDAYSPGVFSAVNYGNGVSLKVVRPQIEWTFPEDDDAFIHYYTGAPLIVNMGGPLIVRGCTFKTLDDASGSGKATFLENRGRFAGSSSAAQQVMLNRVHFKPGFSTHDVFNTVDALVVGDAISICASLFQFETTGTLTSGRDLNILNMRMHDGFGDLWPVIDKSSGVFSGIDADLTEANRVIIHGGSLLAFSGDFRGRPVIIRAGAYVGGVDISIDGVIGSETALQVCLDPDGLAYGGCRVSIAQAIGSATNTGIGCAIGPHSTVTRTAGATTTLAGSLGQLKVGQNVAQTWAGGAATDKAATTPDFAKYGG